MEVNGDRCVPLEVGVSHAFCHSIPEFLFGVTRVRTDLEKSWKMTLVVENSWNSEKVQFVLELSWN